MRINGVFVFLTAVIVAAAAHAQYYEYDPDDPEAQRAWDALKEEGVTAAEPTRDAAVGSP